MTMAGWTRTPGASSTPCSEVSKGGSVSPMMTRRALQRRLDACKRGVPPADHGLRTDPSRRTTWSTVALPWRIFKTAPWRSCRLRRPGRPRCPPSFSTRSSDPDISDLSLGLAQGVDPAGRCQPGRRGQGTGGNPPPPRAKPAPTGGATPPMSGNPDPMSGNGPIRRAARRPHHPHRVFESAALDVILSSQRPAGRGMLCAEAG